MTTNLTAARRLLAEAGRELQAADVALEAVDRAERDDDPILTPCQTARLLVRAERLHDRVRQLAEGVAEHLDLLPGHAASAASMGDR